METRVSAADMTWTFDAITWPAENYFLLEDLRVLRAVNRLEGYFFVAVFLPVADFFEEASFGGGTLPPARRASDSPIAIACLRLVTFLPELPLFNVPALSSFITFSTFSDAFLPYLLDAFTGKLEKLTLEKLCS